jgi:hypothetical protein
MANVNISVTLPDGRQLNQTINTTTGPATVDLVVAGATAFWVVSETGAESDPDGVDDYTESLAPNDGDGNTVAWPDAGSTGLRDPGLLKPSGSVTVTTNGAVIENLDIKGQIIINANNVTVRNVRVTSNGEKYLITIATGRSGIVIEDAELNGRRITTHGIVGGGYTARRVNMYAVGDGFRAGSNTLIEDSWVHDLGHDGAHEASPHFDAVQSIGGTNITIRNNRLEGPWRGQTSAILMMPYTGLLGDVLIENNKLSGGTFTLFVLLPGEGTWGGGASAPYDPARPVTVRNNTFVYDSAAYGPLSDSKIPMKPQPYLVFDGNVYDTGGAVYPGMPDGYYP